MSAVFHSVTFNISACKGCTHCIKRCPTEAIRVRGGKAMIISERCIDCGECIRVCPYHAKSSNYDKIQILDNYEYKIALPAPTLYGQFNNLDDVDYVLTGLKNIGFDDVFEVSAAAELVSDSTRRLITEGKLKTPVISSACPAVVRLIRLKFPNLCEHVLPVKPPMEVAAMVAKMEAKMKTGISEDKIGAFFITPCPAKVTDVRLPLEGEKSLVDGVLAISDIYPRLVEAMNKNGSKEIEEISHSGLIGVGWACGGGESAALIKEKYLAADGMENVNGILETLEDERLRDLDFIELNACPGGCVGGVLTIENPFLAKTRIAGLRKYLPVSKNHLGEEPEVPSIMKWNKPLEFSGVMRLSDDIGTAMKMMEQIDDISAALPKIDCGACGSPSCRALAEDIVNNRAEINDCVLVHRDKLKKEKI